MRLSRCGQVVAQSLCAQLANMECRTDVAYRGNALCGEVSSEHLCGAFSKRIGHGSTMWAGHGRRLRSTDDHH
jgi:hypothetical protein